MNENGLTIPCHAELVSASLNDDNYLETLNRPVKQVQGMVQGDNYVLGDIYRLYSELFELAEAQKKAILEGRVEDALELQERRQKIIDKVQNFDTEMALDNLPDSSTGKNDPVREDFSMRIPMTIEKVLLLDNEMRTIIQAELKSLSDRLKNIQKVKAFCHNAAYHQAVEKFSISI